MRGSGSGRWKTVDIPDADERRRHPVARMCRPPSNTTRRPVPRDRPVFSPPGGHRPDDGPSVVRRIALTAVVRTIVQLPGGPVPGHGSLRIRFLVRIRNATSCGAAQLMEQALRCRCRCFPGT